MTGATLGLVLVLWMTLMFWLWNRDERPMVDVGTVDTDVR